MIKKSEKNHFLGIFLFKKWREISSKVCGEKEEKNQE